jgi:hypothetical protein
MLWLLATLMAFDLMTERKDINLQHGHHDRHICFDLEIMSIFYL